MTKWGKKRVFWSRVSVQSTVDGYKICLDNTMLLTPKCQKIFLRKKKFAKIVAKEWEKQKIFIDPTTMPFTRLLNSALDEVSFNRDGVLKNLLQYADTDLICYRANSPEELVQLQNKSWNEVLTSIRKNLGVDLKCVYGVSYKPQSPYEIDKIKKLLKDFDDFSLVGIAELTTLSGSILLGLAIYYKLLSVDEAWEKSSLDEDWQFSRWGVDKESIQLRNNKLTEFKLAYDFLQLL